MDRSKPYHIVIAEDHKMLRDMLRSILDSDPDMGIQVVGEAGDGEEAIQCVARHHPDLVLMDLSMPKMTGQQAIAEIKKTFPSTKVLVLTMYATEDVIMRALQAGADGYVLKQDPLQELVAGIRHVLEGSSHLSPEVSQHVVHGYLRATDHSESGPAAEPLTAREREIITLVAGGYKSKEIAEALGISLKTVETHRANTMKKLGLRNVAEMTAYAIKEGLVQEPSVSPVV